MLLEIMVYFNLLHSNDAMSKYVFDCIFVKKDFTSLALGYMLDNAQPQQHTVKHKRQHLLVLSTSVGITSPELGKMSHCPNASEVN